MPFISIIVTNMCKYTVCRYPFDLFSAYSKQKCICILKLKEIIQKCILKLKESLSILPMSTKSINTQYKLLLNRAGN